MSRKVYDDNVYSPEFHEKQRQISFGVLLIVIGVIFLILSLVISYSNGGIYREYYVKVPCQAYPVM